MGKGPFLPHQENPRYFGDSEGNPVYLTGSHTWGNLQDFGSGDPPPVFDWDGYLNLLQDLSHNFIRLWNWSKPAGHPGREKTFDSSRFRTCVRVRVRQSMVSQSLTSGISMRRTSSVCVNG